MGAIPASLYENFVHYWFLLSHRKRLIMYDAIIPLSISTVLDSRVTDLNTLDGVVFTSSFCN